MSDQQESGAPDPLAEGSVVTTSIAIDEFLHTPARLNICALLAPADWVTFTFLRDSIGTSDSALSKQVTALESAGYVQVRKERAVRRQTVVRLTEDGRSRFEHYLTGLEEIVRRSRGTAR